MKNLLIFTLAIILTLPATTLFGQVLLWAAQIGDPEDDIVISVFPNPNQGEFNIINNCKADLIRITDIYGQVIDEIKSNENI